MKPPTMEDVAERAGVSRALVSLVMNDSPKVSEARRASVLTAATELGYRPNMHARNLAQRRTGTIGVLINDIHNPFFAGVIEGIESEAERRGIGVLILNGGRDPDRESKAIDTYLQFRVEALVLIGSRLDDEQLLEASSEVPSVIVASGWNHPGIDTVTTDDEVGAWLVVNHLVELGHTHIVHLDGAENISAGPRRDGYVRAMRHHGLDPQVIIAGDDEGDARDAIDAIAGADVRPTAIFAFNDLVAAGALDRLDDLGLAVPSDISLVSYDNTFIAGLRHLSLTTVNQPRIEMGRIAVELISERIDGERATPAQRRLEPTLVIRSSTGPPNPREHS